MICSVVCKDDPACGAGEGAAAPAGPAEERGAAPACSAENPFRGHQVGQDDPACDAEGRTPAYAAAGRSALREEAPTFVPGGVPYRDEPLGAATWQMCAPDAAQLGLHGEFPRTAVRQIGGRSEECTTLMLRNLPCAFQREDLIAQMDHEGFAGLYNLVYMPIDFHTAQGMGYAFVNLVSADVVPRFVIAFDGFRNWPFPSLKVCTVQPSRTQGLDANVQRYRNSMFMREGVPERFRPVLFNGTSRIPFPPPTISWTRDWLQ